MEFSVTITINQNKTKKYNKQTNQKKTRKINQYNNTTIKKTTNFLN